MLVPGSLRPRFDRWWGRDVFISYSRADGAAYALALASRLAERNYACVIDQWGMSTPGTVTPAQIKHALRSCRALVLVGTRAAGASVHVADEVEEFVRTSGMIIPVDLDGTLREATWWPLIEGLPIAVEDGGAVATAPDAAVLERIVNALNFRRRDQRLRRAALLTASVLALMIAGIGLLGLQTLRLAERSAAIEGDLDASRAEVAALDQNRIRAQRELGRTNAELASQRIALGDAHRATDLAERATDRARAETRGALVQARAARTMALAARREAERQLALADAGQLAAQSQQSLEAAEAALLAAQSLDRAWTPQGSRAAAAALARLPSLAGRFELDAEPEAIALSPDGRYLAAIVSGFAPDSPAPATNGEVPRAGVRLWDLSRRREVALLARARGIGRIGFSDDSLLLADGDCDGKITVTATETGLTLAQFTHEDSCPRALRFSGDGRMLAIAGRDASAVYALPSGRSLAEQVHGDAYVTDLDGGPGAPAMPSPDGAPASATGILFDPAARRFLVAAGRGLWISGIDDGSSRAIRLPGNAVAHALSPDGATVAVALSEVDRAATGTIESGGEAADLFLFDVESGRELRRLASAAEDLRFSPDGTRLIVGSERGLRIWNWRAGLVVVEIEGSARSIALSRDGSRLLASGRDGAAVFDARTGRRIGSVDDTGFEGRAAFSADGNWIVTAQDRSRIVRVRSARSMSEAARFGGGEEQLWSFAFSPDGGHLAIGSVGTVYVWDLAANTRRTFDLGGTTERFEIDRVIFSSDGRSVTASMIRGGRASVIDLGEESVRAIAPNDAWSPADYAASPIALMRDAATRRRLEAAPGPSLALANPAGTLLAMLGNNSLDVYDTASGELLFSRDIGGDIGAFDPTGRWLALRGSAKVSIIDTDNGALVGEIDPPGTVFGLGFTPSGHHLALNTGSVEAGFLSLWFWRRADLIAELCRRIDASFDSSFCDGRPVPPPVVPSPPVAAPR